MNPLKHQIHQALDKYTCTHEVYDPSGESIPMAMLSGMSLTANYLAKLDGSKKITAALFLAAVNEVAQERGYKVERL